MTKAQKYIVLAGIILLVLMHVIVPWERPVITGGPDVVEMQETAFTSTFRAQARTEFIGYGLIWPGPQVSDDPSLKAQVAMTRIGVQYGILIVLVFTGVFFFRDRSDAADAPGAHVGPDEQPDPRSVENWDDSMTRSRSS